LSEEINAFFAAHPTIGFYGAGVGLWFLHLFRQTRQIILLTILLVIASIAIFIILAATREPRSVFEITSVLFLFGIGLYVIIGDLMIWRLARYLTRWRGPKWTKELDYVYLTIGAVGIAGTLNRFDFLTGRLAWVDIIAPVFFTTAIVIRFIKTRAEIEEWNK
jgi:hypothetical protein